LRLRPLPIDAIEAYLGEHGAENEQAHLIAHVSSGRPGYALQLLKDESALEFRAERLADLGQLLSSTRVQKFHYAEKMAKDKEAMRQTLLVWLSYWRDVLLRVSGAKASIANVDQNETIAELAERLDLSRARQVVYELETAINRLEHNVNPRLLAEVLLLDFPEV
jgi:DNA polymerase-3 subunit delta'